MIEADLVDTFQRFAMALSLGFLLGVERGWRHRESPEGARAAGLRTHTIMGLLGGVAGALLPTIGAAGFAALTIAFAAALISFKLLETQRDQDLSVTGTLAALTVYALGVYCMHGDLRVAAALGVALVGVMAFKDALHGWLDKLTWPELRSALLILAATAIALPLLPDARMGPWGAINPRELWLLTILVAGASFAGYVAVRVLGGKVGLIAGAAAGALVSSTVVTAELGRRVRAGQTSAARAGAAAALAAAVSVTRVGLFVAAATSAFPSVGPAFVGAVITFFASAWALNRLGDDHAAIDTAKALHSPLDVKAVASFAFLLGALIVIGRALNEAFGQAGLLPFAASAGLADVDAVALAVGSLMRGGLSAEAGAGAILLAVVVNTFAKAVIAAFTGGARYAGYYVAAASAAVLAGAASWALLKPVLMSMFS